MSTAVGRLKTKTKTAIGQVRVDVRRKTEYNRCGPYDRLRITPWAAHTKIEPKTVASVSQ